MVEIFAVNLNDALQESEFNTLIHYITKEKHERISRFRRYEDAQRALIGDILIRYLLCRKLKIKNKKLIFNTNEFGKPFLSSHNDIHFNVSHSGEWVVCCIDNLPVGIDIEQIKPIDMSIAEKFFSKQEFTELMCKESIKRESYFYDLWTLKESYIKAVGKGLSIQLDSFTICIEQKNITLCSANEPNNYYFKQYFIDNNYKMAVCSRKNEFTDEIKFICINELYDEVLLL